MILRALGWVAYRVGRFLCFIGKHSAVTVGKRVSKKKRQRTGKLYHVTGLRCRRCGKFGSIGMFQKALRGR